MKKSENCDFKIFGPTIEMFKKRGRPRKYFSEEEIKKIEKPKKYFSEEEIIKPDTIIRKRGRPRKYFSEEERKNQISIWRCELCNDVKYDLKSKWNHLRTKRHLENLKNKKVEEEMKNSIEKKIKEEIYEIKNLVEKKIEQKFNEKIDKIKKCILTHINQND